MKNRILYLRKEILGLSRVKFGAPIGMSDSEIKNVETGLTQLKETKIPLICGAYNVNEKWLRTGDGDVFLPKTRGQQIGDIAAAASAHDPEAARAYFTRLLGDMTDAEILLMYEIYKRHFSKE